MNPNPVSKPNPSSYKILKVGHPLVSSEPLSCKIMDGLGIIVTEWNFLHVNMANEIWSGYGAERRNQSRN